MKYLFIFLISFNIQSAGKDYDMYHPFLKNMAVQTEKSIREQGGMKEKKIVNYVHTMILTKTLPILESKGSMEVIPIVEKKCPGMTEKIYLKCKGKNHYNGPVVKMYPNMFKYLCLIDHKKLVSPKCIEAKYLKGSNSKK